MEKNWYIEFGINGESLLIIEPHCLAGDQDIADHAKEVREAARHLLAFIGESDQEYVWMP